MTHVIYVQDKYKSPVSDPKPELCVSYPFLDYSTYIMKPNLNAKYLWVILGEVMLSIYHLTSEDNRWQIALTDLLQKTIWLTALCQGMEYHDRYVLSDP